MSTTPSRLLSAAAITITLAAASFAIGAAVSSDAGRDDVEVSPGDTVPGSSEVPVGIRGFAFDPVALSIAVGNTVIWTNADDVTHNVFTSDGVLASPDMERDDVFGHTFTEAGTVDYYCDIHQYMRGTITVTP